MLLRMGDTGNSYVYYSTLIPQVLFFRKGILATGITDIKIEFETLTREQLLLQLTALD